MKSHLSRLRAPRPEDDIALLLAQCINQRRSRINGETSYYRFEGAEECQRRDKRQIGVLSQRLEEGCELIDPRLAETLIADLSYAPDEEPPESRSSALHMRGLRRHLCGEILRLIRRRYPDMAGVTLLSWKWDIAPEDLTPYRVKRVVKEVANYLDQPAFRGARGLLILCLDTEFNERLRKFRLHFHGVACGEYPALMNRHLKPKAAFVPLGQGHAPILIRQLKEPAAQVSYAFKSQCTYRLKKPDGIGGFADGPKGRGVPEPYGSLYQSVMHKLKIGDTIIIRGGSISNGRIRIHNY